MDKSTLPSLQLGLEDQMPGRDDASDTPFSGTREGVKESDDDLLLVEQAEALGEQFDYDGSVLTPEQRRAIFKKYWAMHLSMFGLRSPQYYGHKSRCLSVAETVWPGAVTYLEAEKLKRGYIEPEDLIERLHKLKPSDNFELRQYRFPGMKWERSPIGGEEGVSFRILTPPWQADHGYKLSLLIRSRISNTQRKIFEQAKQGGRERWAKIKSDVTRELTPTPDLPFLVDVGHSPGGTLFPRYLVRGLQALRKRADDKCYDYEDEEYDKAEVEREDATVRWRQRHPDIILADDLASIYRTWPADLMGELDAIDRAAIRCTWRRYMDLLKETEKKMQELVAFWRECGLITGQRTPPLSSLWPDPMAKVRRLEMPPYLKDRLSAIEMKFGLLTDRGKMLRLIEISRWKEAIINSETEPTAYDTPLPQSLLDELDVFWRHGCHLLFDEDIQDEMIARIKQWRKSKNGQHCEERPRTSPRFVSDVDPEEQVRNASTVCSGHKNLFRETISDSAIVPGEMRPIRGRLSRGAQRRSQGFRMKITMADERTVWEDRLRPRRKPTEAKEQTSWLDRLRPRPDIVGVSRDRTKAAVTQTGKRRGIIKQHGKKASKKMGQAATKGHDATAITQKTDTLDLSGTQSHFHTASLQAVPACATKSTRAKDSQRRTSYQANRVQLQGIQKTRSGKRRQTRRLMGAALTTERK
ncbi:hypothetical protein B7494_g883 [Chlorociboria aeruginascens]|nr:hypothetical protein B7494_g883 [Chlorociboria aeruginascens]